MKSVLIFSGGLDSTTLLYRLKNENHNVYTISFLYGQKHSKELEAAKIICSSLDVEQRIVDLTSLQPILNSALTNPNIEIPSIPAGTQFYETLKSTIVPNRNAIFLSIAAGFAQSIGANTIFYAAHHSDRGMYPDCREEFIKSFEKTVRLALDDDSFLVKAPFANIPKGEVIKIGQKLNVPFELTWSCYEGGIRHCGACSACRERNLAFEEAGIDDPTAYEKELVI